jgi:hypothetical protein
MQRSEEQRRAKYFAQIEERRFIEQGMEPGKAKAKARVVARDLVEKARRIRDAVENGEAGAKAAGLLTDEPDIGDYAGRGRQHLIRRSLGFLLESALGPQARLFTGLALLAIFVLWLKVEYPRLPTVIAQETHTVLHLSPAENNGESAAPVHRTLTAETAVIRTANEAALRSAHISGGARQKVIAVENKVLAMLGSWKGGLLGALLVISSLFSRRRVGLIMLTSALLILIPGSGHFFIIPTSARMNSETVGMILGTIVAASGLLLWRERPRRKQRLKRADAPQSPTEEAGQATSNGES